jgi:hypothetical protein
VEEAEEEAEERIGNLARLEDLEEMRMRAGPEERGFRREPYGTLKSGQ